jgi:hypothetical protein
VAAAAFARSHKPASGRVEAIGQAGLRPRRSARAIDVASVVAGVQAQMHLYEKNQFRSGDRLMRSARKSVQSPNGHRREGGGSVRSQNAFTSDKRKSVPLGSAAVPASTRYSR